MNAENRRQLSEGLVRATRGRLPLQTTTPLGFFETEVTLFWPLLMEQGDIGAPAPLRLRPETEQILAAGCWEEAQLLPLYDLTPLPRDRWVRNLLDVLQLAAFARVPLSRISVELSGLGVDPLTGIGDHIQTLLMDWQTWCLERGFVTYGLLTSLFGSRLLSHPQYLHQLPQRFEVILADDVDSYPALARDLFEACHQQGISGVYTYQPQSTLRLGLGADPQYLAGLAAQADEVIPLAAPSDQLGERLWPAMHEAIQGSLPAAPPLPVHWIHTLSRSQLLRQTAETIVDLVRSGKAAPQDIAVIGPGLDALARYALTEILESHQIPVRSLKDQRPLISSALVRSLLTLLCLLHNGLGHLIDQDQVAEMLVVLTLPPPLNPAESRLPRIDPVRAGLLADYCFQPDATTPCLLDIQQFARWDRIGAEAAIAYDQLRSWIRHQRSQIDSLSGPPAAFPSLAPLLGNAILQFFGSQPLSLDDHAVLQELLETAQHLDEVSATLRGQASSAWPPAACPSLATALWRSPPRCLIDLLRQGTITANPDPTTFTGQALQAVTLATAYQYRLGRLTHPVHFWLDIASPLWQQGGAAALWSAPCFLRTGNLRTGDRPQDIEALDPLDQEALEKQMEELSYRVKNQVYVCHSELNTAGQEQMGRLSPLLAWLAPSP